MKGSVTPHVSPQLESVVVSLRAAAVEWWHFAHAARPSCGLRAAIRACLLSTSPSQLDNEVSVLPVMLLAQAFAKILSVAIERRLAARWMTSDVQIRSHDTAAHKLLLKWSCTRQHTTRDRSWLRKNTIFLYSIKFNISL